MREPAISRFIPVCSSATEIKGNARNGSSARETARGESGAEKRITTEQPRRPMGRRYLQGAADVVGKGQRAFT